MTQALLKGKSEYRRRLPHYQKDDRAVFVTFCAGCLDPLPESVRDIVLRPCLHDHGTRAAIHAVVVMPDHVHLLLTPLRDLDGNLYSLIEILQGIKSASDFGILTWSTSAVCFGPPWAQQTSTLDLSVSLDSEAGVGLESQGGTIRADSVGV
jgi:hypothetical protein